MVFCEIFVGHRDRVDQEEKELIRLNKTGAGRRRLREMIEKFRAPLRLLDLGRHERQGSRRFQGRLHVNGFCQRCCQQETEEQMLSLEAWKYRAKLGGYEPKRPGGDQCICYGWAVHVSHKVQADM